MTPRDYAGLTRGLKPERLWRLYGAVCFVGFVKKSAFR